MCILQMFLKYTFGSQDSPAQFHKPTTKVQLWNEKRIWKIKYCHGKDLGNKMSWKGTFTFFQL